MLAFLGPVQMVVVLAILLVIFGPDKLPEMGKQVGKALRELMKAKQEFMDTINFDDHSNNSRNNSSQYSDYKNDYTPDYTSSDSYNGYPSYGESGEEAKDWKATLPSSNPEHGDFAASAFVDDPYAPQPTSNSVQPSKNGNASAAPSGTVSREK